MANDIFMEPKVSKAYLKLSLPLVFSMVVTLIYNLADTFFVAQTNDTAIVAGVSLAAPVFTFLMAFGNIMGQGGSSLISRFLGKQDMKGVRQVSSFCFYITLAVGVVIGALMLIFRVPLLYLIGANEETFFHASSYFTVLSIGAPAVILSFIHSNLLRCEGMSKESMMGTVGGAVVNIILDPILISVLQMGALGAAIATIVGYIFSDLFFVWIVWKKSKNLSVNPKEVKVSKEDLRQIMGIGIPAAIINFMSSISVVLVNQFLLPYGNEKIAAMGIVLKVNMIALLILTGFAYGGQPLFGYHYGSGNRAKLSELLRFCLRFLVGIAVILTVILFAFAPGMIRIFMDQGQIVPDGALMLRCQVITMPFVAIVLLMTIIFQSTGKIICSFVMSISRQGVIFFVVLFLAYTLGGYTGILVSQAIADVVTAVIASALFYKQLYHEFH